MNRQELSKILKNKIETVLRQYKLWSKSNPYIEVLQKIEKKIFSNNLTEKEEAVKGLKSLLLTYRAWEDGYYDTFFEQTDKYKDKFVDDFKNWDEWYDFLESIVKDAQEYVESYKKDAIS